MTGSGRASGDRSDRRRPGRAVRRLWDRDPTLRAVVVEGFFTRLGFGIVTLYLPLYALELGMSLTEIGLLAGAKAMITPAVKPLMGVVVDRFGARRGYLAAVLLRLIGAVLLVAATTPATLFAVRFLQGAASAARDPASVTVLAKQARARLGRTFSTAIGAKDLGNVSAGLVGGALLALSGGSFRTLWILTAVLAVVPVAAIWRWVPRTLDARRPAERTAAADPTPTPAPAQAPQAPVRILRDGHLRRIAALGLLSGLTAHMLHGLFQVYAAEVAGLSPAVIGAIYSGSIATLLVVGPVAGYAADRFGTGPLAGVRGVANAASSLVFALFPVVGGVIAGRLIDDTGKAAFRPTWGALLAGATQRAGHRGGRVAANLDTALSIGEALGPLLAGLVWDLAGVGWFFALRGALGLGTELFVGRRLRTLGSGIEEDVAPAQHRGPGALRLEGLRLAGSAAALDLEVPPGTRCDVDVGLDVGELRAILDGARPPDDGRILVDGCEVTADPAMALAVAPAQVPGDTLVSDALRSLAPDAPIEALARAWCTTALDVAIGHLLDVLGQPVRDLDGDFAARLGIAAALVADRPVLVLHVDPGAGGDPAVIARAAAQHSGAVLVLHGTLAGATGSQVREIGRSGRVVVDESALRD